MQKQSTERKRELRFVSHQQKVQTVLRVLNGESRTEVRKSTGVAESTLRGWLSRTEIVDEARDLLRKNSCICTNKKKRNNSSPVTTPVPHWDLVSLISNGSFKDSTDSNSASSDLSSHASKGQIHETFPRSQYYEQFHWTSDDDDAHSTISNNNDNCPSSSLKRKRIELDYCIDEDLPVKRRVKEHDASSSSSSSCEVSYRENQQEFNELESRDCTELLHELVEKDTLSRDLFVYLLETLQ